MTWRRTVAIASVVVAILLLGTGAVYLRRGRVNAAVARGTAAARAPEGQRVRVEVINATNIRGLARRATELLRDHGFDVVAVITTAQLRDSTVVVDRSGHMDWSRRIAAALSGARVEARPDSSHDVDATVFLGASWHPPSEPFDP